MNSENNLHPPPENPRPAEPPARAEALPKPDAKKPGGLFRFVLIIVGTVVLLTLLGLLGWRSLSHNAQERAQTAQAIQQGAVTVQVVKPSLSPPVFDMSLPGSADALTTATIYARVNGYLKTRLVDIGDHVEAGQLLAEIDAPDTDAQARQAQAQLVQSRAAEGIARITLGREKELLDQKVVAKQEYDTNNSTYQQAVANTTAAQANVANSGAAQIFEKIVAPFTGTIVARNLDTGALIASGGGSGVSVFTEAATDILRVYINVPQSYTANIKVGQEVQVSASQYPQKVFEGKVTRMADALDATARTERVEIQLPSENGKLSPGMYLSVRFQVTQAEPALTVPASVLDIRNEGPQAAVVDADGTMHYRAIKLGRDFGKTVEVVSGLKGDENLVVNPMTDLLEGEKVEIAASPPPASK